MLELKDITLAYGQRILLGKISVVFGDGRLTAMLGRNGAGKSTLMRAMLKMENPVNGHVLINGRDIRNMDTDDLARSVSFVGTEKIRVANLACSDLVALGRAPYTGRFGRLGYEDRRMVETALELTGMKDYAHRTTDSMSDGECQKIMIARALAQDTPVMLLDEPTAFLDIPGRYETAALLHRLASEAGKTIIFSTHDLDVALREADDILLLDPPDAVFGKTADITGSGAIEKVFGFSKGLSKGLSENYNCHEKNL